MAASVVGADSRFGNQKFRAAMTDVFAGAICSVLSIAYCLSYAALIFSGPLEHLLAYGVAVTFLSAAVGGAVVALRSSIPFAIAGPTLPFPSCWPRWWRRWSSVSSPVGGNHLLEPTLIALSLATALTGGLLLCFSACPCRSRNSFRALSGDRRLSRRDRLVDDHRRDSGDHRPAADVRRSRCLRHRSDDRQARGRRSHGDRAGMLLRRVQSAFVLPGVLLAAIAATHLVLLASGVSLGDAQAAGWMFRPQAMAALTLPWKPVELATFRGRHCPRLPAICLPSCSLPSSPCC